MVTGVRLTGYLKIDSLGGSSSSDIWPAASQGLQPLRHPELLPLPVGIILSKFCLQKFSHRRARNLARENESIGELPLREFIRQKRPQFFLLHLDALLDHYHRERPFLPLWMR